MRAAILGGTAARAVAATASAGSSTDVDIGGSDIALLLVPPMCSSAAERARWLPNVALLAAGSYAATITRCLGCFQTCPQERKEMFLSVKGAEGSRCSWSEPSS